MEVKKYFKQMNVYENINLYEGGILINQINGTWVDLYINQLKVIDTMEGDSLEGQVLTGKKLIIIGSFHVKIFIISCDHCKMGYWIERCIPFSTFIIVPKDICEDECIHVKHTIEDVTTSVIEPHKIFVSITFLLEYEDEY